MFRIYDVSHNLVNRGCLRYMMNRNRHMRERVKCLRCMMNWSRLRGSAYKINDEPQSPNEGACLRYMMNRKHRMKESVYDI